MADVCDTADDHAAPVLRASIQQIRDLASKIPVGYPGICIKCEEESLRLVVGCCARCRDKYQLS